MARDAKRDDAATSGGDTIRDGNLIVDESMNRREGLVEYEGTVGSVEGGASGTKTGTRVVSSAETANAPGSTGAGMDRSDPLSMSTDNTAAGMATSDTVETGMIAQVREGMRVVDAGGADVGKVADVRMGDPSAVTTQGEDTGDGDSVLGDAGAVLFGNLDTDLPESFRHQLARVGYIRVDGAGWFDSDRYASADQITDVSGDTVRLSVDRDSLTNS